MNYSYLHLINPPKVERFDDVDFKVLRYVVFVDHFSDSNSSNKTYIIELENSEKQVGLFEVSIPDVWTSLKSHISIGQKVKASGLFYYDKNSKLILVRVDNFCFNNMQISNREISLGQRAIPINRNILQDKKLIFMIIVFICSLMLMQLSVVIFGIVFVLDVIILASYASTNNKKLGKSVNTILEEKGCIMHKQPYTLVINKSVGFPGKTEVEEKEIND